MDTPQPHLLRAFPALSGRLPWVKLADRPSRVHPLSSLGRKVGLTNLWIKRDDQNSPIYSGNKVRKYEYIFADLLRRDRKVIYTAGGIGSNHAVATALFARHFGLRSALLSIDQPVLSYVRENILLASALDMDIHLYRSKVAAVAFGLARYLARIAKSRGDRPCFVYFGGSSPTGTIAFIDAVLELKEQIDAGEAPVPAHIFVATGSCGTMAGIEAGLRIAGLPTKAVGVRVVDKIVTNRTMVSFLANRAISHLRRIDPSVPAVKVRAREITLLDGFFGGAYGRPTSEGKQAIRLLAEHEGISLDPTYTGKAVAGMLDFLRRSEAVDRPSLFWHTRNGVDMSGHLRSGPRPEELPARLQRYFVEPLFDPDL